MKKLTHFLWLLMFTTTFCISCDDDITISEHATKNYLPIAQQNSWNYNFTITSTGSAGQDSTFMNGTQTIEGRSFTQWNMVQAEFGLFETVGVTKEGNQTLTVPLINGNLPEEISIMPFTLIDDNASPGTTLTEYTVEQELPDINIPDSLSGTISGTITPTIQLTIHTTCANHFEEFTLNSNQSYSDVLQTDIELRMQIDLAVNISFNNTPLNINHTIIPDQRYGEISHWYANDIGLVRAEYNFDLEEFDTTIEVPLLGEIDLNDFGVDVEEYLDFATLNGLSELSDYSLE